MKVVDIREYVSLRITQLRAKRDELRLRLHQWLDTEVPIPLRPIHIGSAHNFINARILPFTWRQHLRLLIRTFMREMFDV